MSRCEQAQKNKRVGLACAALLSCACWSDTTASSSEIRAASFVHCLHGGLHQTSCSNVATG